MDKGTRVGCVLSADENTVKFIGYGTYEGEEVPPEDATGMGAILHELGRENPKIKLDDGGVAWGCECWWGSEEKVKELIGDRKVEQINMEEFRSKVH